MLYIPKHDLLQLLNSSDTLLRVVQVTGTSKYFLDKLGVSNSIRIDRNVYLTLVAKKFLTLNAEQSTSQVLIYSLSEVGKNAIK